jgi:hypothetical protein
VPSGVRGAGATAPFFGAVVWPLSKAVMKTTDIAPLTKIFLNRTSASFSERSNSSSKAEGVNALTLRRYK